jgi:hypothetical protein
VTTDEKPASQEGYKTMRKLPWTTISLLAAALATGASAQNIDWQIFTEPFVTSAHAQEIDWQKVDDALGRKPAASGDVRRYGFPRSDLSVTLDGVTIKPALALGGWVAFKPMHGQAMVMGDLVLLERAGSTSPPSTIICCAPAQPPSTCTSAAMATRPRWPR